MKVHLLFKLRRSKLTRNRKGFSSIIGGIFMVLIVITLASSYFIWTLSQNTVYNEAIRQNNQLYSDRLNEKLVAKNTIYVVLSANTLNVSADLVNGGSVPIQVVTLWVVASNGTQQRFNFTDLRSKNINLNPGSSQPFNALVQIQGIASTNAFSSWFVTARGNTIPLEKEQLVIVANLAQGIGSMAIDFATFGYFTYASASKLASYPAATVSFDIPRNEYVAFRANLTNFDPRKQTITLDSHSLFWQPGRPGVSEGAWFIVNVEDNGQIKNTYTSITLAYLETKTVIFASQNDLGIGSFSRLSTPNAITSVACFLLLHGTIGSAPYGQSIPFVSVFFKP